MPRGRAPEPGEKFSFPAQAKTLQRIAETKGEAFYRGELAEKIAAFAKQHGAALTLDDLAAHKNDWVEPIGMDYRGFTLHEIPPNGQGIAALIALGILENFDVESTRRRFGRQPAPADRSDEARVRRRLRVRVATPRRCA